MIGAVGEDGEVCLNHWIEIVSGIPPACIERERQRQLREMHRRQTLYRAVRPAADIAGRTAIIVDDGVTTGASILAALHGVKARKPRDTIVAVPIGLHDRLMVIAGQCDQLVCADAPSDFHTIACHYQAFEAIRDADVVKIFEEFAPISQAVS